MLYFYPADFTPGCTKEACAIRDLHDQLTSAGMQVVGISPQGPESHRKFRERYELPFSLLCDEEKHVIRMYKVDGPLGIGVRHATFLVNRNRVIQNAILADFRIGRHAEFMRRAISHGEASRS